MRFGATDRWRTCYSILTYSQVGAAAALSAVAVISKMEVPAGATGIKYELLALAQANTGYILVFANFVLWTAHVVKKYYGNPWAWDSVKVLLDEFREHVFYGKKSQVFAHSDRVTLFKFGWRFRWCIFPTPDWLFTVERSGHMTRRKRVWFRVKDDGHSLQGVAGETWGKGSTILVEDLPLLRTGSQEHHFLDYAKKAFTEPRKISKKIKANKTVARSLCGIIVEVSGRPWGVIVIDSANPKLVTQDEIEKFYQKNAKLLAKLLAVI